MPLQIAEPEILGACTMGHDTFLRIRKELVAGGYIRHVPQPGRKRPHYYIVSHAIQKMSKE